MKIIDKRSLNDNSQKGQSLVELALTITILLTLLAGAFDIGSAFLAYIAMRDAAQEGAVYASVFPKLDTEEIFTRVIESSTTPLNFAESNFVENCDESSENTICIDYDTRPCSGDRVTITVRYRYHLIVPFLGGFLGTQDIPLHASVTNEILSTKCN